MGGSPGGQEEGRRGRKGEGRGHEGREGRRGSNPGDTASERGSPESPDGPSCKPQAATLPSAPEPHHSLHGSDRGARAQGRQGGCPPARKGSSTRCFFPSLCFLVRRSSKGQVPEPHGRRWGHRPRQLRGPKPPANTGPASVETGVNVWVPSKPQVGLLARKSRVASAVAVLAFCFPGWDLERHRGAERPQSATPSTARPSS